MKKPSILIVDDMIPILELMSAALSKKYDLVLTSSLNHAKTLCVAIPFDCVLTDINLSFEGSTGGYDLIKYLIKINYLGKIGIMSGYLVEIPEDIKDNIAFKLDKPFTLNEVIKKLDSIL